jgi:hypothetical protein
MNTKELLDFLVTLIGIGGILFGVYQYQQAQKWKRLEFAASQLQRLTSEPELALAGMFLNYSIRGLPLPETYWEYAGTKVFEHDCQRMYRVMATRYENKPEFFIYTDIFEHLFEYLVQIYAFIDMKLIKTSDVKSIRWILEDLAKPQWIADNRIFIGRISSGFSDILKLMDIFGIEHADEMSREQVLKMDEEYAEVISSK